jgi:hypothetical protein
LLVPLCNTAQIPEIINLMKVKDLLKRVVDVVPRQEICLPFTQTQTLRI